MVRVGGRPILLQMMKYYAHFGHTEFILCLGYKAHVIKEYFLDTARRSTSNLSVNGGKTSTCYIRDRQSNWQITFVDTGLDANIGERLLAVRDR